MKIAIYQFNATIGACESNTDKIIQAVLDSCAQSCDLFIVPELAICGYPPEDLLYRSEFHQTIQTQLSRFLDIYDITLLITAPYRDTITNVCYNSVFVIRDGVVLHRYDKQILPNYSVFDDKRYFASGNSSVVFNCAGVKVGVVICEDMWKPEPIQHAKQNGAELIFVLNASPFDDGKYEERIAMARQRISEVELPLIYVNYVGGQDEVVYDGASFMLNKNGDITHQLPAFTEQLSYVEYMSPQQISYAECIQPQQMSSEQILSEPLSSLARQESNPCHYPNYEERIYTALVVAVRDYVYKNDFKGVVLGLSGGIDSALTLAIAVDALGTDNVCALMMPSCYTLDISLIDARDMVKRLNITKYHEIDISSIFNQFQQQLSPLFNDLPLDATEENLQARTRGTLQMAMSNKFGYLVLTTGNKSEMATGYATLYGDMAGGFAVLKDVYKTVVYKLCIWRNQQSVIIPERIITRPPSAELRDNQVDQDSLPDYVILDKIIKYLVEDNLSSQNIIKQGFSQDDVLKVAKLLKINEYKRRQSAVGPKITGCGFTKDWRYPITHHFKY